MHLLSKMNLELTLSSLQDKGWRITKVRRGMVKIFSENAKPLSVRQLERELVKSGISVNKTTIYREVKFLLDEGYLVEVYIRPNEVSYESAELRHHHHLICDSCGSVFDVTDCLVAGLEKEFYQKKGFRVERHVLEFYGTCANCA